MNGLAMTVSRGHGKTRIGDLLMEKYKGYSYQKFIIVSVGQHVEIQCSYDSNKYVDVTG